MNTKKQSGFSLVEVMIALVILAVGILGISKLQGTLIKNSSNANQRSVAVSLAQKKIDDLKSFATLTSSTAWSAETIPASGIAFTHIADNEGGAALGSSGLTNGTIVIANTTYTLSWTAEDYMHNAALAAPIASTPSGTYPDMKLVTVLVTWTDEGGDNQQVSLNTVIDSYPPAATALSDNSSIGDEGPTPTYTPELAPDVIDVEVNLDNGANRQTSKPLPDAVKTGADSNTLVTFEVVTYHNDGTDYIQTRREEYQTVDCSCQFAATDGAAFPPGHVIWDEENNERLDYIQEGSNGLAQTVTKPTATQTGNANAVDELCDICCRDHHDVTSTALAPQVRFDGQEFAVGDHLHYQADGTLALQSNNDVYIESCRYKRIDGILRVFQDWKLYDVTTMDREALASLAADGGIQDTYSSYVQDYVLSNAGVSTVSPTKPDAVTNLSMAVGDPDRQLEVRGIYIDNVYDLDGNLNPTSYLDYVQASSPVNDDRLEKIPFSEVNLSLLSDWDSDDDTQVSVTNEPVATISDPINSYYGTYSRGLITPLAGPGTNIEASIDPGNDGITQKIVRLSPPTPISDLIVVGVSGVAPSPITISGSIDGSALPGGTKFEMTGCTLAANGTFSCTYPSGSNVNITVSGYKKNTACVDPAVVSTYSQTNVTSSISGISIAMSCN
jgi:type IV pilus modification protein PilV